MTEQRRRRIDIVSDPDYLADLSTADDDDLRGRRSLCSDLDTELSYYRRLLHGRMDLLAFEAKRRSGEETRSLIEALPEILAANTSHEGVPSDRPISVEAPDLPAVGRRPIDFVLGDDFIARLPMLSGDEMADAEARLREMEAEVSAQRKTVHTVLDAIQAELSMRFRNADSGQRG